MAEKVFVPFGGLCDNLLQFGGGEHRRWMPIFAKWIFKLGSHKVSPK